MKAFMDQDFLLETETAKMLYHDYAAKMPVLDYHCHISPQEIAEDRQFENITQVWLGGDHYKWRQMRSNGVDEYYITGDAPAREKFQKWAETLEKAVGNPLFHWSHLELKRYFGYHGVLNGETAEEVWNLCNQKLHLHTFNDSLADAVINEKTELLYGQDYIEEELLGLRFKITPFSFFQTNSLGAEVLYSKAREYVLSGGFGDVAGVDDTGAASAVGNSDAAVTAKAAGNVEVQGNAGSKPVIYDLYTGTGTIAQMLSPVASKVIGVVFYQMKILSEIKHR